MNLSEALQQELAQLKATAESMHEVGTWMKSHAAILGLIAPERHEQLQMDVELRSANHYQLAFDDVRYADMAVTITSDLVERDLFESTFLLEGDTLANKILTAS